MQSTFHISDLAREFDVTPRTLRFYEEKGLLSPRREGSKRSYSAQDRVRLKLILRGKRLGLSLDESSQIINLYDPTSGNRQQINTLLERIREKRAQLLQQRKDLNSLLADLKRSEQRCLDALVEQRMTLKKEKL